MEEKPLESSLNESDVRDIVRLLGKVIAEAGGIDVKRKLLLDGLCRITGAAGWVWGMAEAGPDKLQEFTGLAHGGGDDEGLEHCLEVMTDFSQVSPDLCPSSLSESVSICGSVGELPPSPQFLLNPPDASGSYPNQGTGTFMASLFPTGSGGLSGIGIYRHPGSPGFGRREACMARILLTEIPWLHSRAFPDRHGQRIESLYPRHRTVLDLLCKGWSRKRISEHLGVSINTVHGYVKAVFKQLEVHSQAELVSRFKQYDDEDDGTIHRSFPRGSTRLES